jgi:hypothetical protein
MFLSTKMIIIRKLRLIRLFRIPSGEITKFEIKSKKEFFSLSRKLAFAARVLWEPVPKIIWNTG